MISFKPIKLKSIIHYKKDTMTTFDFKVKTLPLGLRVHIKDLLNIIQGLTSVIHTVQR